MNHRKVHINYYERGDCTVHTTKATYLNGVETSRTPSALAAEYGDIVRTDVHEYHDMAGLQKLKAHAMGVAGGIEATYLARQQTDQERDLNTVVTTYSLEASTTLVEGVLEVATHLARTRGLPETDRYEIARLLLMAEGLPSKEQAL